MLVSVATSFQDEVKDIKTAFIGGSPSPLVQCSIMHYQPLDDGCVVSLWDLWNRYLRDLYLTSASGPVRSVLGTNYSPSVNLTEAQALAALRNASQIGIPVKIYHGEPKWFIETASGDISRALGLANAAPIRDALAQANVSIGSAITLGNPVEPLHKLRNYIAHKSLTHRRSISTTLGSSSDISAYLRTPTLGGSTQFEDWCDALVSLAWDAAL